MTYTDVQMRVIENEEVPLSEWMYKNDVDIFYRIRISLYVIILHTTQYFQIFHQSFKWM